MARILLIHGYGVGQPEKKQTSKNYFQFLGFKSQIDSGEAVIFQWFNPEDYSGFNFFNVISQLLVYRKEKKKAQNTEILSKLYDSINSHKPEIIFCHSMGSFLLLNTIKERGLPEFVKKIIFVQADISINTKLPEVLVKRLKQNNLRLDNFYCPWDPALLTSIFLNFYIPAGLIGLACRDINNHFYPLHSYIILHLSSIRSAKFITKLLSES